MRDRHRRAAELFAIVLVLATVGGFVDAVGYLELGHIFISHMSGNTASGGAHLGRGEWGTSLHRIFPVPFFVAGVWAGAVASKLVSRTSIRAPHAVLLTIELVLLAAVGVLHGAVARNVVTIHGELVMLTLAMGIQNATVARVAGIPVRTTFITAMLDELAEAGASAILERERRREALVRVGLYSGVWSCFFGGALVGGVASASFGVAALLAPSAALALIAARDVWRPFASAPPKLAA